MGSGCETSAHYVYTKMVTEKKTILSQLKASFAGIWPTRITTYLPSIQLSYTPATPLTGLIPLTPAV